MPDNVITFRSGELNLEGIITPGNQARGAVMAHPHPLYGGSMYDYVVSMAAEALIAAEWTVLRFNFRGVGRSEGQYSDGVGEAEDIVAAVSFLKESGAVKVLAGGYSFGAMAALKAWPRLNELGVLPLVLIAPPVAGMSMDDIDPKTEIGLMICGENDAIASPDQALKLGRALSHPIEPVVIPQADHFFGRGESDVLKAMKDYLEQL
ncbi:MAG: alpha/beta fold hydrolase [Deltaproteobacteria bacterium]|nr:alpha/beta fold hydrolase [Deltaproteobacteria bacterium]